MLPGGTDGLYRAALAASHTRYVRVDVLDAAGNVLDLPSRLIGDNGGLVFGRNSAVTASLQSRVTRTLRITVPRQLYPATVDGLLAPYGNRLQVTMGIEFADGGRYAWTVFTGRIQQPVLEFDGLVVLRAADRAYEVAEAGFVVPENSQVGSTVNAEFTRLVSDAVPDAVFGVSDSLTQPVPQLSWMYDRAWALDDMSTTAGAFWYALADGSFVQRYVPWTVPGDPVVTLRDGTGGVLVASPSRSREDVYNSITVSGERADGTVPVYAFAEDANPASATYVNGPFGRRHRDVRLQTPQTQGTAQAAANAYLRRSVGLLETWRWTQPPDAAKELGDVVGLEAFDRTEIVQVVSGFTLPLDLESMMQVQAHPQVIGQLT